MRICSEHKRENSDIRVRRDLSDIINYCKQHGHRPPVDSAMTKRINAIHTIVYKRSATEAGCPRDFIDGINEIKSYPTYEAFTVQQEKANVELQATKAKELFEKNTRIINKYFPKAKILRSFFGEDKYKDFVNKNPNPFGLKIFSIAIGLAIKDEEPRLKDILFKTSGVGITDQDIKYLEEYYAEHNMQYARKPSKDGLSKAEMGRLFLMSGERVGQLLKTVCNRLEINCGLSELFNKYMTDDIDGMLALLPRNLQHVCKFQKEYNLLDAPVLKLSKAGNILLDFYPDIKKLNQYSDAEQVFPKIGVLLDCLSDAEKSNFMFVLNNRNFDAQALKIMSVFFEDLILQHSSNNKNNTDVLLKRYGFGVTDKDLKLSTDRYFRRYKECANVSKQGLTEEQLAALYYTDVSVIKDILTDQTILLRKRFMPMYNAYMYGSIDNMVSVLPESLRKAYAMQQMHRIAPDETTKEMFEAGRALFKLSVLSKEKTK